MRSLPVSRCGEGRGRVVSRFTSRSSRRAARAISTAAREAHYCSECLEPRLLLAAHTWIGASPAGLNQLWSYGPNWIGGAPGATEAAVALVFPAAGVQKILIDDIVNLAQVDS